MEIAVLLVDDHALFRKGVKLMLDEEDDIVVVGEAGNGEEAVMRTREFSPDVIIMDITMPEVDGIEATRRIVSEFPDVNVIPLSIHSGKRFVENMLRAGASGYILKESVPEELVNGIRAVQRGDMYLSSAISGVVISEYVRLLSRPHSGGRGMQSVKLTEKEEAMLPLVAEGHSVKEIAAALGTSTSAARSTQQRMINKLGVQDLAELTEYERATRWSQGGIQIEVTAPSGPDRSPSSTPILGTKFHRPIVPSDFLSRARLLVRLGEGCERPLTLISAPAGYGKSTLVADWVTNNNDRPVAWLSLGGADSEIGTFLKYFVAAVNVPFPKACPIIMSMLQEAPIPEICALAEALCNDLDAIDQPFVLVLDDYHLIENTDVHELLENLLKFPPRPLHLVLITRHDPPFSLAALRAHSWVTEIRQHDLQFSRSEVSSVLKQTTDITFCDAALAQVEDEMEGWIVGLRLLALMLIDQKDPVDFLSGLKGGFQQVHDYLLEEVLAKQPAPFLDLLIQTSVLERFCAPLVDAVCFPNRDSNAETMTGDKFIHDLARANLFIIHLDAYSQCFRYHHLFQDVLRRQLTLSRVTEQISALHARASAWFVENAFVDEALRHALAAIDPANANEHIERKGPAKLEEREWCEVAKRLSQLPDLVEGERLCPQKIDADLVDRLLAAFPVAQHKSKRHRRGLDSPLQPSKSSRSTQPSRPNRADSSSTDSQPVVFSFSEPLTYREMETLELLSERLYDKEIAKTLSISIWTVKSHVKHILEKLQVNNRRQAVLKAEELGLLKRKS